MKADTILLTEDDPTDALLLRRALDKAAVSSRLEVVSTGEEAIAYLSGEGRYADRNLHPLPSLVLLDIRLPRMSGLDILAWIRQQAQFQRTPVIMLTSSGQAADIRRAYEAGASAYHEKPSGPDGLVELVRDLNRSSYIWTDPIAAARPSRGAQGDDRMFPAAVDQPISVKSKIHRLLSRHPAGLTPESVADEFLRRGIAVGEREVVSARIEEILNELELARSHRKVVRAADGRYRAIGTW
jgi:DNA-binding response OmpR family regulator